MPQRLLISIALLALCSTCAIAQKAHQQLPLIDKNPQRTQLLYRALHELVGSDGYVSFFIQPGVCPRCENIIDPIIARLKSEASYATVIVLHGHKSTILEHYRRTSLPESLRKIPILIDTIGISDSLSCSSVPFVAVIKPNGIITTAESLLGFSESVLQSVVDDLVSAKEPMPSDDPNLPVHPAKTMTMKAVGKGVHPNINGFDIQRFVELDERESPISELGFVSIHPSRDMLFATDLAELQSRVYNLKNGSLIQTLTIPDSIVSSISNTLSPSDLGMFLRKGFVKSMTFTTRVVGDRTYTIASLPKLSWKIKGDDSVLQIAVQTSILRGVLQSDTISLTDALELESPYDLDTASPLINLVFYLWVDPTDTSFFVRCAKGYTLFPENRGPHKIDTSDFYLHSPSFIRVSSTGQIISYGGPLSSPYRNAWLGYNILEPSILASRRSVYYTQSLSDSVYCDEKPLFALKVAPQNFQALPDLKDAKRIKYLNETKSWTIDGIEEDSSGNFIITHKHYAKNNSTSGSKAIRANGGAIQKYTRTGVLLNDVNIEMINDANLIGIYPVPRSSGFWLLSAEGGKTLARLYCPIKTPLQR